MKDLKVRIEDVIKTIDSATTIGDERLAWSALGYCKAIFEMIDDALPQVNTEPSPLYKVVGKTVSDINEIKAVNKAPVSLQEYCEKQKEVLKHDIIAEEEATLYKNRAVSLKDEVVKRWPNTNTTVKKILNGHGIRNIEEFYDYFTTPAHWEFNSSWGLSNADIEKFHNLYMTLNEEAGCSAEEKFKAYICKGTSLPNTHIGRIVNYLRSMNIDTKAQLRWYVHNIGDIPNTKGIGSNWIDSLNKLVKEELALHAVG